MRKLGFVQMVIEDPRSLEESVPAVQHQVGSLVHLVFAVTELARHEDLVDVNPRVPSVDTSVRSGDGCTSLDRRFDVEVIHERVQHAYGNALLHTLRAVDVRVLISHSDHVLSTQREDLGCAVPLAGGSTFCPGTQLYEDDLTNQIVGVGHLDAELLGAGLDPTQCGIPVLAEVTTELDRREVRELFPPDVRWLAIHQPDGGELDCRVVAVVVGVRDCRYTERQLV